MMSRSMNRGGAKYQQLIDWIRSEIASGALKAGDALASENQMCQQFSVSRGPVRQALAELEREGLIYRVPGKGSFIRERVGGNNGTHVKRIKVVVDATSSLDDNFVILEVIEGLNRAQMSADINCKLSYEFHPFTRGAEPMPDELAADCDGILAVPLTDRCAEVLRRSAERVPLVSFLDRIPVETIPQLYIDHESAARRATQYLMRYGHRRIGLLLFSPNMHGPAMRERLAGYQRGLEDEGLTFDPSLVEAAPSGVAGIATATRNLLDRPDRPTALIIGGGLMTGAAMQAVQSMALRVPEDLSVIAFDDTVEAKMHNPPLCVVRQPLMEGVGKALTMLLGQIDTPGSARTMGLMPELVLRNSCSVQK